MAKLYSDICLDLMRGGLNSTQVMAGLVPKYRLYTVCGGGGGGGGGLNSQYLALHRLWLDWYQNTGSTQYVVGGGGVFYSPLP